jgi:hypothetical protein
MEKILCPNLKKKFMPHRADDALGSDQELSDFEIAPASESNGITMDLSASDTDFDQEEAIIQKSQIAANRKGKKSGGFQSMGKMLWSNA